MTLSCRFLGVQWPEAWKWERYMEPRVIRVLEKTCVFFDKLTPKHSMHCIFTYIYSLHYPVL